MLKTENTALKYVGALFAEKFLNQYGTSIK